MRKKVQKIEQKVLNISRKIGMIKVKIVNKRQLGGHKFQVVFILIQIIKLL